VEGRAPRDRLAVALDVPRLEEAEALIAALDGVPGWLKVGSQLFTAAGPAAVRAARRSARVFLDIKLHDIPNTVAGAVTSAADLGVSLVTLHGSGGRAMLRAAREAADAAAGSERIRLVAVTVLTSLSPADLKEVGIGAASVEDQVARIVDLAVDEGIDGVVVSPREAEVVRRRVGDALWIVTPGVRPAGPTHDDQARVATPAEAIAAGSDLLVVGRPVVRADDPASAARDCVREIEGALAARGG